MKYLIIYTSEIDKVDFEQILESRENLVYSQNKEKTYISWQTDNMPPFVENLDFKQGPLELFQLLEITETYEWMVIV
jgi:hypothetical protein